MFHHTKRNFLFQILLTLLFNHNIFTQWTVQHSDTNYNLTNINFLDQNTGMAGGDKFTFYNQENNGVLYKTTNAGVNWNVVFSDTNLIINNTYFLNDTNWLAVGGFFSNQPKLLKSTNFGNNWFYISPGEITSSIKSLHKFNQTIYAACKNGIFKSTNNGNNWSVQIYYPGQLANSYFINENTGWCAYDDGYIFKTINGGLNWNLYNISGNYSFSEEIYFIDQSTGFLIYDIDSSNHSATEILKSTNGGINWVAINPGFSNLFTSIFFVNENTGYISGLGGNVLKTTNTGNSWSVSWTGIHFETLLDIKFLDPYIGYACGTNSIIIKTINGGFLAIPPISTKIPKEYSLWQNYPNPFNPNTKIKFAIPKSAFVKLAVYDMLGREVGSLVNQHLTSGTYEVNWNASKFSSGIYFYRIETNDFQMVKKMSLIK